MTISSTGSARLESGGLLFPKSVHKTGTALYVQTLGLFMVMKVVSEPQKRISSTLVTKHGRCFLEHTYIEMR